VLFWHVGGTVAAIRYAFRDDRMDLRLLVVGAVLPDLVDTPVGMVFFGTFESVRLAAHSLLFGALVMAAVVMATRRGRPRKRWMPLAVGVLMHLFLDAMWADPETLWWPFLGWSFSPSGFGSLGALAEAVVGDWRVWVGEAAGIVYLGYLARRGNLASAAARARFLSTGRIDVPIERR
jgi:membrane-bound metal-dependent hydrolase YbcI (DUF457 family)